MFSATRHPGTELSFGAVLVGGHPEAGLPRQKRASEKPYPSRTCRAGSPTGPCLTSSRHGRGPARAATCPNSLTMPLDCLLVNHRVRQRLQRHLPLRTATATNSGRPSEAESPPMPTVPGQRRPTNAAEIKIAAFIRYAVGPLKHISWNVWGV